VNVQLQGQRVNPVIVLVRNSPDLTRAVAVPALFGWTCLLKQTARNWLPQPQRRKKCKEIWVKYVWLAFLLITELSPELYLPTRYLMFSINTSKRIPLYDHPIDHRCAFQYHSTEKMTAAFGRLRFSNAQSIYSSWQEARLWLLSLLSAILCLHKLICVTIPSLYGILGPKLRPTALLNRKEWTSIVYPNRVFPECRISFPFEPGKYPG
jgi:hypothetical protein